MPTVFLSSTAAGLTDYRDAVYKAIQALDGYKCVRMEDFGARSEASLALCREKVEECDLFVGIAGAHYGSIPEGESKSYTELEFDWARAAGMPTLMFTTPVNFQVSAGSIESDSKRSAQKAFREKIRSVVAASEFEDSGTLSAKVIQAIHNHQATSMERLGAVSGEVRTTLIFPLVTNQAGFDTGISVTNASAAPFGSTPTTGNCVVHYFGVGEKGATAPTAQTSAELLPGEQLIFTLSAGNRAQLIEGAPAFQGYIVVECGFADGYGYAMITDGFRGIPTLSNGYLAERVTGRKESIE